MRSRSSGSLLRAIAGVLLCATAASATARSGGIATEGSIVPSVSPGCATSGCHTGGSTSRGQEIARICTSGTSCGSFISSIREGAVQNFTASLERTSGVGITGLDLRTRGGFALSATAGSLAESSAAARLINGQLTHNGTTTLSGSHLTWASLSWTAPTVSADSLATLRMCGQLVDGDGINDSGDGPPDCILRNITVENNAAPTISNVTAGSSQLHNQGSDYSRDVDATDPEGDGISYTLATGPTGMTINSGSGVISWPNAQQVVGTHTVTVRATDTFSASPAFSQRTFSLQLNAAPSANAGADKSGAEGSTVTLNGSASNITGDPNTSNGFSWTQVGGSDVSITNASSANASFTAPPVGPTGRMITFRLTVTDGGGLSDTDDIVVTITNVNVSPTANAGSNQTVNEGDAVLLNGSASTDPDGTFTFSWAPLGPAAVSLTGATTATPSFTAPEVSPAGSSVTVRLTVTDDLGATDTDDVLVTINNVNRPPTANAGAPFSVREGTTGVMLDGTASSDDDDALTDLTFAWTQTGGPDAGLTAAEAAKPQPTFDAPLISTASEVLTFSLVVTDTEMAASTAATVMVTVTENSPPVITASGADSCLAADMGGADCVAYVFAATSEPGSRLLDLSATDAEDGTALTILWADAGVVSDAAIINPLSTATTRTLTSVTATDSLGDTDMQPVVLDLDPIPVAAIAFMGVTATSGTIDESQTVSLDGAVSSDLVDTLTAGSIAAFAWQVSEDGAPFDLGAAVTNESTLAFTAPPVAAIGATRTLDVELVVTDSRGQASVAATFTLTVQDLAIGDPEPVISALTAMPAAPNEGVTTTLSATVSDNGVLLTDGDLMGVAVDWVQVSTGAPSVTLAGTGLSRTFSYTEAEAAAVGPTFRFAFTANDGINLPVTRTLDVTVNNGPTANAGSDRTTDENTPVALDGSASSDPEGSLTFAWSPATNLTGATSATPTFTPEPVGPDGELVVFTLTVTDAGGLTSTDTVSVSVSNVDQAPTALAGDDQTVDEGTLVTLSGDYTDPDDPGSIITFAWTQQNGTAVVLTGADTASPTFTAPEVPAAGATLTFALVVTDETDLASAADTVVVNVANVNRAPTAEAGPIQTLTELTTATLDGSNSDDDDDRDVLLFSWSQVAGISVVLTGADSASPTFTTPQVGFDSDPVLTFQLTVTDTQLLTGTDTVMINVSNDNQPPVANAGSDVTVNEGAAVRLDGSGSVDPDLPIDDQLTFLWVQASGPAVDATGLDTATPSFVAPNVSGGDQVLTFALTVTDRGGLVSMDDVIVNVTNTNDPPTADAGPDQTVAEGSTVTLNGGNSRDPDGGISAFSWHQVSGPAITFSAPSAAVTTFVAPRVASAATIVLSLTVTGDEGLQARDEVTVNVTNEVAEPPVANAGVDQTVAERATVMLDGSQSFDPDGFVDSFLWMQTSGPGVSLSNATAIAPTFVAPSVDSGGTAIGFQLTVTDNDGARAMDDVVINVSNLAVVPLVNAGADRSAEEGTTVTLSGAVSDASDPAPALRWRQVSGAQVVLRDPTSATTRFVVPAVPAAGATALVFELTAVNADGLSGSDSVAITPLDNGFVAFADNVVTVRTNVAAAGDSGDPIGVTVGDGDLVAVAPVAPASITVNRNRPQRFFVGLLDFELVVASPGGTATVTVQFASPLPAGTAWAKFDGSQWIDYSDNVVFAADGLSAAVTLVDGAAGDDDGVANGVISDPSGPATFASAAPPPPAAPLPAQARSSSGGGCSVGNPGRVDPTLMLLALLAAAGVYRSRRRQRAASASAPR